MPELWELTAVDLAARLAAGEVTATDAVTASLERIAAVNPAVNAIVTLDADAALATAHALDRIPAARRGPLHGMPIAVKGLEDTAGLRTTYGCTLFADHVPDADTLMVARLRAAGAVIVGKTNTPEFGAGSQTFNRVFGATRNPWDLTLTPGGSSGGAAAAVAAGMVPFADGSDLGGSIRNPASLCNLVGLRPSPGRIPDPDAGPFNALPVLGPIARTAGDAALLLSALAGPDPRVPLSGAWPPLGLAAGPAPSVAGLSVAWTDDLGDLPVAGEVTAALRAHARPALESIGCRVRDADVRLPAADRAFEGVRGVGFAAALGPVLDAHPGVLKATIEENVAFGRALSGEDVGAALDAQAQTVEAMRTLLRSGHDVLALPATQVAAFDVGREWVTEIEGMSLGSYIEWMRACSRITVTAHPAISVPGSFTGDGRPVGLQLVGRHGEEGTLLALATALEEVTGASRRRAPGVAW